MPHHDTAALSGVVQHVFAHRFTLEADGHIHLADLGPKGVEAFPIEPGLAVRLEGERRPSEIKVTRIAADGRAPAEIEHKKPHHRPKHDAHDDAPDPARALAAAREAGWTAAGEPRGKHKHVEVLARRDGFGWCELHIDASGHIKKSKPADPQKWALPA